MKDKFALVDAEDSILIVIDVQDSFIENLDSGIARRVVDRICWLVQVAKWLRIPIIVTAEDKDNDGQTNAKIRDVLPDESPDLNKVVFGLAGQAEIMDQVLQTGRKTVVLVGLETDVCVQHSAFGLAENGFNVAVVADATASPRNDHEAGIDRLRDAGITLVHTKGLFFEWVRDLEKCKEFFRESGIDQFVKDHKIIVE